MKEVNVQVTHTDWLEERTILLSLTGSHAYGTNTDTSDKDYKGVCIPPINYYLGLKAFKGYDTSGGKNFKNTKDDIDITIFHINKFVQSAMQGVPNNIELLFARPQDYVKVTRLGQKLIDRRHLFLSKRIEKKFGGYASSQIQKLKSRQRSGAGQEELIEKFGYDTKFFMHSIRLLTSAIEILRTGDFSTFRPNRDLLLKCRTGAFSFEEALEMIETYDHDLKLAAEETQLPDAPDEKKVDRLLVEINK